MLKETAKIPGIDGNKMSKSYHNMIEIFLPPKQLRKKIMSIKTDSTSVDDPKNPNTCSVFALYTLLSTPEQQAALSEKYRAGGMGYGEAKQLLYDAAMEYFGEARARREKLGADLQTVEDILQTGAHTARAKGKEVLDRMRTACGLIRPLR